jgi:hypothetical protein
VLPHKTGSSVIRDADRMRYVCAHSPDELLCGCKGLDIQSWHGQLRGKGSYTQRSFFTISFVPEGYNSLSKQVPEGWVTVLISNSLYMSVCLSVGLLACPYTCLLGATY